MAFDPRPVDPAIDLRIRNMIDAPGDGPRGGGQLQTVASRTGRQPKSQLPEIRTLANADVRICEAASGKPVRATRTGSDGLVHLSGLIDVLPGTRLVLTIYDGATSDARVVDALSVPE